MKKILYVVTIGLIFYSCNKKSNIAINNNSIEPGSTVALKGQKVDLSNGSIKKGEDFVKLIKSTDIDFNFKDMVTILSIVPSIDTKVCDAQTHKLGESGIDTKKIDLVTISRDLPMAQSRFANEANLENITYYSDYKSGSFGKKTGLMMKGKELLTRGVVVLDKEGTVQYMQFVSEVTELPDMEKAFTKARELAKK